MRYLMGLLFSFISVYSFSQLDSSMNETTFQQLLNDKKIDSCWIEMEKMENKEGVSAEIQKEVYNSYLTALLDSKLVLVSNLNHIVQTEITAVKLRLNELNLILL